MRIALVHSVYANKDLSGENVTVEQQAELLGTAGHTVHLVTRSSPTAQPGRGYSARAAWRVATGHGGSPARALAAFRPDVVHLHNLFPNIGTDWLSDWAGPVVATLHNFRYACANGLLLRDDRTCTDCATTSSWASVRHACYRDSRLATVPLAIATRRGLPGHPVVRRADRLVALSAHALRQFALLGGPAGKADVVPHGIAARHDASSPGPARARYLYVGRLAAEKGIVPLVRAWPAGIRLDVVGDGPESAALHGIGHPDVRLLGARDAGWRDDAPRYTALVFPGIAIESAVPRVVIEAWEAGLPVVANAAGGVAAEVQETGAGSTYRDPATLRAALAEAADEPLRRLARTTYERTYTPHAWVTAIESTYARAIARRRHGSGGGSA